MASCGPTKVPGSKPTLSKFIWPCSCWCRAEVPPGCTSVSIILILLILVKYNFKYIKLPQHYIEGFFLVLLLLFSSTTLGKCTQHDTKLINAPLSLHYFHEHAAVDDSTTDPPEKVNPQGMHISHNTTTIARLPKFYVWNTMGPHQLAPIAHQQSLHGARALGNSRGRPTHGTFSSFLPRLGGDRSPMQFQ